MLSFMFFLFEGKHFFSYLVFKFHIADLKNVSWLILWYEEMFVKCIASPFPGTVA